MLQDCQQNMHDITMKPVLVKNTELNEICKGIQVSTMDILLNTFVRLQTDKTDSVNRQHVGETKLIAYSYRIKLILVLPDNI